jgi:hypothetical protein
MVKPHPALARLDVLVGRWTLRVNVEGLGTAWTEFAWQDGGLFLRQYTDAEPPPDASTNEWWRAAPFPVTSVIGLDDTADDFAMLYADGRGVHRVYRMTFADGLWTMWRGAPGFNQRFTGTLSDDGDTIAGQWEMSRDGATWHVDFGLTYTRES